MLVKNKTRSSGFILMEAMVATAIFVMAVLSLARCIEAGLQAGVVQRDDARARRALLNRMRELESGAQSYVSNPGTDLKGEFEGMRMVQNVLPLSLKDQRGLKVDGTMDILLEVQWKTGAIKSSKQLRFYVFPMAN